MTMNTDGMKKRRGLTKQDLDAMDIDDVRCLLREKMAELNDQIVRSPGDIVTADLMREDVRTLQDYVEEFWKSKRNLQ